MVLVDWGGGGWMSFKNNMIAAVMAAPLMLAACAGKGAPAVTAKTAPATKSGDGPNLSVIAAGTALAPGYKLDAGRTMIFGTDERWTGRLAYTTGTPADDVFDFLHREMPHFGWVEITAMRSDTSLLTFTSDTTGRVATIHIDRGSALGGSTRVEMVISPRDMSTPVKSAPRPMSSPVQGR